MVPAQMLRCIECQEVIQESSLDATKQMNLIGTEDEDQSYG